VVRDGRRHGGEAVRGGVIPRYRAPDDAVAGHTGYVYAAVGAERHVVRAVLVRRGRAVVAWVVRTPVARAERFVREYGLPEYDADLITSSRRLADWYEAAVKEYDDPKAVANWVMGELLRLLKAEGKEIEEQPLTPAHLVEMLKLMEAGTISGKIAKSVFEEMFQTGKRAEQIVKEKGLVQISDEGELVRIIDAALAANPKSVADFKAGKEAALGFLVGQVMKETKGRANPGLVNRLLRERLAALA
jgi:aspartyl-tRNA(Asn)/glutamyl-tRNA(Gln) amidotransferase subunit B